MNTLQEKLEQISGKRDSLARRVLNTAPRTTANLTADEIRRGITLERLESLNVPVYRYDTQITIHGKVDGISERSPLYTVNGNGSIGVRYAAIDAEKKKILVRCSRVAESSGWHANFDSSGLTITRMFIVRDEAERHEVKLSCLTELRAVDSSLFYGWTGAFSLAYGAGYAVQSFLGAIPADNLWTIAKRFFGIASMEELTSLETAVREKREAEQAKWREECAERNAEREIEALALKQEHSAFIQTVDKPRLENIKRGKQTFTFYSKDKDASGNFILKTVEVAKRGQFLCHRVSPSRSYDGPKFRRMDERDWQRYETAAKNGRIFQA